jgi:prevent-host-death family protein
MAVFIPVSVAKTQLSRLVDRAVLGEDIVLTKDGHPQVRLTVTEGAVPVKRSAGVRPAPPETAGRNGR